MWILKLELNSENQFLGIIAIKNQVTMTGYPISFVDKKKYLVPNNLTLGQFIFVIKNKIKLSPEKAIFLFIAGTIPASSTIISQIYESKKDKDGFLYVEYSGENTFG